jgi:hypothetical protein
MNCANGGSGVKGEVYTVEIVKPTLTLSADGKLVSSKDLRHEKIDSRAAINLFRRFLLDCRWGCSNESLACNDKAESNFGKGFGNGRVSLSRHTDILAAVGQCSAR